MMSLLRSALVWVVCSLWVAESAAQEMTPRSDWLAPKGNKVLVAGYSYTSGDVLFDRSLPVSGVDSRINVGVLDYVQTLGLWGRLWASVQPLPGRSRPGILKNVLPITVL